MRVVLLTNNQYNIQGGNTMQKLFILSSLFFLTACANSQESKQSSETSAETSIAHETSLSSEESSSLTIESESENQDSLEVTGNTLMTEVGQWKNDDYFGKMTLEKIKPIEEKFNLTNGLDVTITDIKLFKVENLSNNIKSDMDILGISYDDVVYSLQIAPVFESTSSMGFKGVSFDRLVDSEGFQQDTNLNEIIYKELSPNAKSNTFGSHFILPDDSITNFTIYANHLTDDQGYVVDSPGIELTFE